MKPKNRGANGAHGMNWIRQERRFAIYARDGFQCIYCLARPDFVPGQPWLTLDHVTPRRTLGSNLSQNLVTACVSCNSRRRDLSLADFCRVTGLPLRDVRRRLRARTMLELSPMEIATGRAFAAMRRSARAA